jgi:hypothetical protein
MAALEPPPEATQETEKEKEFGHGTVFDYRVKRQE